jgi:hypothetical protein
MLAGLPLDGQGACFPDTSQRLTGVLPLSWAYFGSIDIGHPWKTTPADLKETLLCAGFSQVRLLQREQHLTVVLPVDEAGLTGFRRRRDRFHRYLLRPLQVAMSAMFPAGAPFQVMRFFYALERRLWFGGNRFKNAEAPEVMVIAE